MNAVTPLLSRRANALVCRIQRSRASLLPAIPTAIPTATHV